MAYLENSRVADHAERCSNAGRLHEKGVGVTKGPDKSKELSDQACDSGRKQAAEVNRCDSLGPGRLA